MNSLEALNILFSGICLTKTLYRDIHDSIETSLKALEIIKKKRIYIDFLLAEDKLEKYNKYCSDRLLTQEEFDLLKKELEK